MRRPEKPNKVGDLRPSQLVFTFGVGALLDLPNISVIVLGLDDWKPTDCKEITEDRLIGAVKSQLGPQVGKLYLPPVSEEELQKGTPVEDLTGIPVAPFPRWGKCSRCELLAPLDTSDVFELKLDRYRPDRARFVHSNCSRGRNPTVLPVRFLIACRNGHLDDFPWLDYVHRGKAPCQAPILRLRERGASGEAAEIWVHCESCESSRSMAEAFGQDALKDLVGCSGRNPHLRTPQVAECDEQVKTILLSASNSWFPLMLSALAIPRSFDRLAQMVDEYWAVLGEATSLDRLQGFRAIGQLAAFAGYSDEDIWETIEQRQLAMQGGVPSGAADLKLPEWEAFSGADRNLNSIDFKLRPADPPIGCERVLTKTVLAERLRQVCALVGFTRVESPGDFQDQDEVEKERRAPLSRQSATWVPATEVRGEGIFLQFDEGAVKEWCQHPKTQERERQMLLAHKRWRRRRRLTPEGENFPGVRYVLLHSFSHALMRQLTLECGYTAASIRERIYSRYPNEEGGPMAGILIYTGAPDSEGTLGGLVKTGEPRTLGRHIEQALEQMRVCASDPFCAEQQGASDGVTLHLAACHACLFSPETSCERGNKYLDRACLVPTFGSTWVSFFEQG